MNTVHYSIVKSPVSGLPGARKNAVFLLLYQGLDYSDVTNFETSP